MKIIYLGTPSYAIAPLERLFRNKDHEIIAIVTQPAKKSGRGQKHLEPPLATFAKENKIKLLQPTKASDCHFLDEMASLQPDLCITCAYGQILTEKFLSIPTRGTINIHPSLLPLYRGAVPVPAALLAGDKQTGISILFTVKELDAGNIIIQKSFNIEETDTSETLLKKLFFESGPLLEKAIKLLDDPSFIGIEQDKNKVIHCKKINKQDGKIDWERDAHHILNTFRAYHPWPGSFTFFRNKRVVIEDIKILNDTSLNFTNLEHKHFMYHKALKILVVNIHNQFLGIKRLKIEGKKSMTSEDFWNGHQLKKEDSSTLLFS